MQVKLQEKTTTIDRLAREQSALASELEGAQEACALEERKHDVLQQECVALHREFMQSKQALENQLHTKMATIEELMRGHAALTSELQVAKEAGAEVERLRSENAALLAQIKQ